MKSYFGTIGAWLLLIASVCGPLKAQNALMSFGTFSLQLGVIKKITIASLAAPAPAGSIVNLEYLSTGTDSTPDNPVDPQSVANLRAYLMSKWLYFPAAANKVEYFLNPSFVNITVCENATRGGIPVVDINDLTAKYLGSISPSSAPLVCP